MKIYTVYKGEVVSMEVRETKARYISTEEDYDKWVAFDYGKWFDKGTVCTSAIQAIKKEITHNEIALDTHKRHIEKTERNLKSLNKLLKSQKR